MARTTEEKIIRRAEDFWQKAGSSLTPETVVVQTEGVYDVLHPGHLNHLEQAKSFGDVLVVSVARDECIRKGPGRPLFNQEQRMRHLAALEIVDYVVLSSSDDAADAIRGIKPNIYSRGPDYPREENPELAALREVGGDLRITDAPTDSSSRVSVAAFQDYAPEIEEWLADFRKNFSADQVLAALAQIQACRILVFGERSIDNVCEVAPCGAIPGESHISVDILSKSMQADATGIIRQHIAEFASCADLLTQKRAIQNISYIERGSNRLLFEAQECPAQVFEADEERELLAQLESCLDDYDLVILADYGHGVVSPQIRALLEAKASFLAATVKTYHANYGKNLATKYEKLDYLAVNELEHALATAHSKKPLPARYVMRTQGAAGLKLSSNNTNCAEAPSLAVNVVDPCGAGDAVLAYTAPLLAQQVAPEIVAFIGSCAAAIHCEVPINSQAIHYPELEKFAKRLLS